MKKSYAANTFLAIFIIFMITLAAFILVFSRVIRENQNVSRETTLTNVRPSAGRVLFIDAGHGGEDGGAVSLTGQKESELNLKVAQKLQILASFYGLSTKMTRDSQEIAYPEELKNVHSRKVWDTKQRVSLINQEKDAFLISIHQNKYTTSGPSGCQVFYTDEEQSKAVSDQIQAEMRYFAPGNRKNAVKISKDIYLMNNITCPGILVECAFLSNPADSMKIEQDSYQLDLVCVILGGYCSVMGR